MPTKGPNESQLQRKYTKQSTFHVMFNGIANTCLKAFNHVDTIILIHFTGRLPFGYRGTISHRKCRPIRVVRSCFEAVSCIGAARVYTKGFPWGLGKGNKQTNLKTSYFLPVSIFSSVNHSNSDPDIPSCLVILTLCIKSYSMTLVELTNLTWLKLTALVSSSFRVIRPGKINKEKQQQKIHSSKKPQNSSTETKEKHKSHCWSLVANFHHQENWWL